MVLDCDAPEQRPAVFHMRLLIVSLSTYTSPYFRGMLDHLAGYFEALEVAAADIPTLWGPSGAPADSPNYNLHLLRPRLDLAYATIVLPGLGSIADRFRPTSVMIGCEPWQFLAVQSLVLARRRGIPVGIHFAENGPRLRGAGGMLRRPLARLVLSRCAYSLQWSETGAALSRALAPSIPVGVIPGGIPEVHPRSPRGTVDASRWFAPPAGGSARAAYVGRLAPEKGITDLLEILDRVHARMPVAVAIAGDGPLRNDVEDWTRVRPWAQFHGLIERTIVPELFAAADVALVPSRSTRTASEQFGMAAMEALGAGTPVIAYDTGALAEAVGSGGVVVREGDVPAFADAVVAALSASEAERRLAHERALAQASLFTYPVLARQHVEFWRGLPPKTARAILGPQAQL
jgi:glycosyltransferase involved in cell wall biosynthesis